MPPINSQILLIENVLTSLNENIYEKDTTIKNQEEEIEKLKSTITTLKHECKAAFGEQERLEESIMDLKKQTISLSQEIKLKDEQIGVKVKEYNSLHIQHEQFMDNVEKRVEEFRQQIDNKNSIILELENINKELNKQIKDTKDDKTVSISKLERKLEQEEFKNFINTDNNFDFNSSKDENLETKKEALAKINPELQLDKLENKLNNLKKEAEALSKKSASTEEELLKRNLGF